ncbi:MAG TPA: 3'(2'),5'-bisphosphate nucleotidase [Flavobacteriales bacterium]|nr:3'(2'),5'-bisphosphate nucleotidase [Flavobacteriales bacterium]|tara:strand:- start:51565 stop:52353 length:789 start_codon:yes stop_codon:yes gene_type:complete
MEKYLPLAIEAAVKAGIETLKIYDTDFDVYEKQDASPLTEADKASHNIIMSFLQQTGIPVLSEEGKEMSYEQRQNWQNLWIVDPLDGTKEFIKKNGEFTINIALIENQKPVLGVIYVPVLKTLYFGSKKSGAFKVEEVEVFNWQEIEKNKIKIPVNEERPYTVVASRSHLSSETSDYIAEVEKNHGNIETLSRGSSLKLCMIAEGKADEYPRFAPTMEWDTAAGQAIIEASGGEVIDWETKQPMLYNRENLLNNWFLAKRKF